jgi:hypothetical protein
MPIARCACSCKQEGIEFLGTFKAFIRIILVRRASYGPDEALAVCKFYVTMTVYNKFPNLFQTNITLRMSTPFCLPLTDSPTFNLIASSPLVFLLLSQSVCVRLPAPW